MTLTEWRSNKELGKKLALELDKPIWQMALSVLEDQSYARKMAGLSADAIQSCGAALAGKAAGYEQALETLRTLAEVPTDNKGLEPTYGANKT